jgi:hypothetical protein
VASALPGRSVAQIKITGVTYVGAQWTIAGETPPVWRETFVAGTDSGDDLLQLLPSTVSGTEHTVGYEDAVDDTLSIEVRYSVDDPSTYGPTSTTSKSFTGPEAPDIDVDGWITGSFAQYNDLPYLASGIVLLIGGPDTPPAPEKVVTNPAVNIAGTITVELTSPPIGTVDQVVYYAGQRYPVDPEELLVSFPYVTGEEIVYAVGITAAGTPGLLAIWPLVTA